MAFALSASLFASRSYTPQEASVFEESWRWSELEALAPYVVRQVDEAPDGSLWFGVHGGLVRYDGYVATFYSFEDAGLEAANSMAVKVASDGAVYVLTNYFCARFKNGQWFSYPGLTRYASTDSCIEESADGSIWVAAVQGLHRISGEVAESLGSEFDSVNAVKVDRKNRLWYADGSTGTIRRSELDPSSGALIGTPFLISTRLNGQEATNEFHEGPSGKMWMTASSDEHALRVVEGDTVSTVLENWDAFGLANRLLTEMPDGRLWVASSRVLAFYDEGEWFLEHMDKYANWFTFLYNFNDSVFIMGGHTDKVYTFDVSGSQWEAFEGLNFGCQEVDGTIWFLGENKRVVRWDPELDTWISFGEEDGLINQPNAMMVTSNGSIWVSGAHNDNAAVAWLDGPVWKRQIHPGFAGGISHASAIEGKDGCLYFGSNVETKIPSQGVGGFIRYRVDGNEPVFDYLSPPEYPRIVYGVAQASNGDLWFGGRSLFRKPSDGPLDYIEVFKSHVVDNVIIDSNEVLWVGDWRAGVSRYSGGQWERFSVSEGRTRNRLVSLLSGRKALGVWAATTEGLSRFDGTSWSRHTDFPGLRLQREGGRLMESNDGHLWINSAPRSWNFNLDAVLVEESVEFKTLRYSADTLPPETRIDVFESKLPESGNAYFEWSGIDAWSRTWSDNLEFSYRLNEDEWGAFRNSPQVSIPSLGPGDYRLEVRARDADWNIDPTPAVVHFTVTPFLWKRPWFLVTVISIILLVVTLSLLLVRTRVKHIIDLEEFKMDFFTSISHELRTPLAVILGPLESLLNSELGARAKEKIDMAYRNARKMQGLVDQLLEFRKVELGKLKYEPVRSDVVLFLKDAIYAHAALWERKQQVFRLECEEERSLYCFDPDKLQRIVSNLLSNAIKYTPEEGSIDIRVDFLNESGVSVESAAVSGQNDTLMIQVTDTGVGIAADRQELIFKPFYRERDVERNHEGSGIGLAYTNELVNLWGGSIEVESPIRGRASNVGTRFTVLLPLIEDETVPNLIASEIGEGVQQVVSVDESVFGDEHENSLESEKSQLASILVVDDNSDVRLFLKSELSKSYDVHVAGNGEEALLAVARKMPDLVVTDLMMPEVDGLELCSRLKTSRETSHIPILMLTARGSDEFRLKGIENGADDYFAKPVNLEVLKARIESLLESRQRLRELFTRQIVIQPKQITVTSTDEKLLTKAIALVEENMQDEDFDVESFAEKMGMGRASLYRKMTAIVGQPPFKFIRSIRLKRAAQLLESGSVNVSETIEKVGIAGISHFGKIFRDEYGESPSEYRKRFEELKSRENLPMDT